MEQADRGARKPEQRSQISQSLRDRREKRGVGELLARQAPETTENPAGTPGSTLCLAELSPDRAGFVEHRAQAPADFVQAIRLLDQIVLIQILKFQPELRGDVTAEDQHGEFRSARANDLENLQAVGPWHVQVQ